MASILTSFKKIRPHEFVGCFSLNFMCATQNIDIVCQYILPFLHNIIIYCLFLMNLILEKNQNVPQLKTMTIIICYGGSC